jgi:hypothetical protein
MSSKIEIKIEDIQNRIFTIRGRQIMLDRDLAEVYGVEVKRLNEQVKRNIERFPETFRFQLTDNEKEELVANCDRFKTLKHSSVNPYAFTEQGVAMLSAVLRSKTAVKVSIQIMQAFVEMKRFIATNAGFFQRLEKLEKKQLEADKNFERLFQALEDKSIKPKQGIFYDGQVFDAYVFVADLIKTAKKSIILIDNYIDETVLQLFTKRNKNVRVKIHTRTITQTLKQDLEKHNTQYPKIEIEKFDKAHDRFLIIDQTTVYHFGASLKDLGKKWFAFSKMEVNAFEIIANLGKS